MIKRLLAKYHTHRALVCVKKMRADINMPHDEWVKYTDRYFYHMRKWSKYAPLERVEKVYNSMNDILEILKEDQNADENR